MNAMKLCGVVLCLAIGSALVADVDDCRQPAFQVPPVTNCTQCQSSNYSCVPDPGAPTENNMYCIGGPVPAGQHCYETGMMCTGEGIEWGGDNCTGSPTGHPYCFNVYRPFASLTSGACGN